MVREWNSKCCSVKKEAKNTVNLAAMEKAAMVAWSIWVDPENPSHLRPDPDGKQNLTTQDEGGTARDRVENCTPPKQPRLMTFVFVLWIRSAEEEKKVR